MNSRQFHLWSGILLALPMFIVGLTAVFIAHDKSMGLKYLEVPFASMSADEELEVQTTLQAPSGELWLGGKHGLFVQGAEGRIERQAQLEVRQLALREGQLWIASKTGLFELENGLPALRLEADVRGITVRPDGALLASVKEVGVMQSADGRDWQPWAGNAALLAVQGASPEPYTFGKLVMDLHTGKAFFGKKGEWIWIDVLGIVLCLLSLTGVWVWWQGRRRAAA